MGESDQPPLAGLSTRVDQSFRVDTTQARRCRPRCRRIRSFRRLTTLSLDVVDPILPTDLFDPLVVPTQKVVPRA